MNIVKIINEEIKSLRLDENNIYDFYELSDNVKHKMFNDFLYDNNTTFTKNINWTVVSPNQIKKIWEDYMKYKFVRNTKGLEKIEEIFRYNIAKISVITELTGHSPINPEGDYEDNIGYFINEQVNCIRKKYQDVDQLELDFNKKNGEKGHIKKEFNDELTCNTTIHPYITQLIDEENLEEHTNEELRKLLYEHFKDLFMEYYVEDPKSGHAYITDYGLEPLYKNYLELENETDINKKVPILDKILNVVHQRSDLASWFVEGGVNSLFNISGYETSEKPISFNQYGSNVSG